MWCIWTSWCTLCLWELLTWRDWDQYQMVPRNWMRVYSLTCPLSWGATVCHVPGCNAEGCWASLVPTGFDLNCPALWEVIIISTWGYYSWKHTKLGHTLTVRRAQSSLGHCLGCSGCSCCSQNSWLAGRERSGANKSGKAKRAPERRVQFPSPCPGTVAQKSWGCCLGILAWRKDWTA